MNELADIVLVLADNKHQLGRRYADWATSAPTLEAATAAAAMAQAELGHARALLPILRDCPAAAGGMADEDRPPERFVALLDRPFASWVAFVAANAIFDAALTTIFANMVESSYAPLRGRARKIIEEEHYHAAHGNGWLRRLGASGGEPHAALERAAAALWAETLCFFGPPDDPVVSALHQAGVIAAPPDELRRQFVAQVQPVVNAARLTLPEAQPLPWERWDALRRRLD